MSTLDRVRDGYENLCVFLFIVMIAVALIQVLSRSLPSDFVITSSQFLWTAELSTNLLIFIIFVGAGAVHLNSRHITITVIRDRITERTGSIYEILISLVVLTFIAVVTFGSYRQMVGSLNQEGQVIDWFRVGYLYAFLTAGFVIILLAELGETLRKVGVGGIVRDTGGETDGE